MACVILPPQHGWDRYPELKLTLRISKLPLAFGELKWAAHSPSFCSRVWTG